jgi:hypothetical protein
MAINVSGAGIGGESGLIGPAMHTTLFPGLGRFNEVIGLESAHTNPPTERPGT